MNILVKACFFLFLLSSVYAADDNQPAAKLSTSVHPGNVFMTTQAQSLSGLQTATLTAVSHQSEFTAYGIAVDIHPLIELRRQYLLALTEQTGTIARFKHAEQSLNRQQNLYQEGSVSKRDLQVQQAQWQTDKAQLDASGVQSKSILDEASLSWGKKLTEQALTTHSDLLGAFLSGKKTLLQITLPVNKQLANDITRIEVEASGNRSLAIKAELISAALHADNTTQGESYFFQTEGHHIRPRMRVFAWIPESGYKQSGVVIPKSALIWHLNQAFVYVKTAAEQFHRCTIDPFSETNGGYFVGNGVSAGDELVITGGQLLLSEEFKGQIPDEND
jgi:multidrug efflux pump subunit AcrA (membrane-fusion protein)